MRQTVSRGSPWPSRAFSLPAEMMRQIEEIRRSLGFAGRSELVRAGIRLLLEYTREKDSLKGKVSALIIVTRNQEDEAPIAHLKHEYEHNVQTHIYSKASRANCVELVLGEGEGAKGGRCRKPSSRKIG